MSSKLHLPSSSAANAAASQHAGTRKSSSQYILTKITKDGSIKKKYVYPKKMCIIPGCNTPRKSRGLCKKHGGAKQCDVPGCLKNAKSGGKCIHHGGGLCIVAGCKSGARKNRMCYIHNQENMQRQNLASQPGSDAESQVSSTSACSSSECSGDEEDITLVIDLKEIEPLPWSPNSSVSGSGSPSYNFTMEEIGVLLHQLLGVTETTTSTMVEKPVASATPVSTRDGGCTPNLVANLNALDELVMRNAFSFVNVSG